MILSCHTHAFFEKNLITLTNKNGTNTTSMVIIVSSTAKLAIGLFTVCGFSKRQIAPEPSFNWGVFVVSLATLLRKLLVDYPVFCQC